MKRIFSIILLALGLPMVAFASSSVDFGNSNGTLSGSNNELSLKGSELVDVTGLNGTDPVVGDLGTVSFTTGSLINGSLVMGGTFSRGGSFVIAGNGSSGVPTGDIFNGAFTGASKWSLVTLANGTHQYTLRGAISGTWYTGEVVHGAIVNLTVNTGKGYFNDNGKIVVGWTNVGADPVSSVPEPGTLGMLGTGLVGLAGALNRKRKAYRIRRSQVWGSCSKQLMVAVALAFLMPVAAHATGCVFATNDCLSIWNSGGNAGGSAAGMTLSGANVYGIKGTSLPSGDRATLSFTTGALTSGSLSGGGLVGLAGVFASGGTVKIRGTYGNIKGGTIFSGSFSSPTQWIYNGYYNNEYNYTLTGSVSGTWDVRGSYSTAGSTVQIDFTSTQPFGPGVKLTNTGGVTQLFGLPGTAVVPEPSSLMLMGTGLLGAAFAAWRKVGGPR